MGLPHPDKARLKAQFCVVVDTFLGRTGNGDVRGAVVTDWMGIDVVWPATNEPDTKRAGHGWGITVV